MKKVLLVLSCVLVVFVGRGQDETMRTTEQNYGNLINDTLWTFGNQPKLMIVPFKPMMFRSSIVSSIGRNDGISYDEVVNNFRKGLDDLLYIEANLNYSVVRMSVPQEEVKKDLHYIYRSLRDDYRVLEVEEEEPKKKIKIALPKKKSKEEEGNERPNGSYVEGGQIKSHNDGKPHYMACQVSDTLMFDYLYNKYNSVLYLVINQVDLNPQAGLDYRAFEGDEYQREITVHYSIFTHNNEVHSGVSKAYFSSTINHQKDIISEYFPVLVRDILGNLPVMTTAEAN